MVLVFLFFLAFVWVFIPFLDEEEDLFVPPEAALLAPEEPARAEVDFFAPAALVLFAPEEPARAEVDFFAPVEPVFFAPAASACAEVDFFVPALPVFFAPAEPALRVPPEADESAALLAPLERTRVPLPEPPAPTLWDFDSLSKPAGLRRCSVLLMLPNRSMLPL